MNAEQLLDALSQLPDDLIAETDVLRRPPEQKRIPWKRLIPIAACLALVLSAVTIAMPFLQRKGTFMDSAESVMQAAPAAPESVMDTAPALEEAPAEKAPTEVGGVPLAPETDKADRAEVREVSVTARTVVYGSTEPNGTCKEIISSLSQLENSLLLTASVDVSSYDETWFKENQLILFLMDSASSSVRYHIHSIRQTAPGCWELTGTRSQPKEQTDDAVQQLIIVELPRMVEPEDVVLLNLVTGK